MIQWIRWRYQIPPAELKRPEELTVQQVAERFGASDQVVYYWIEHGVIQARRLNPGMPYWITLNEHRRTEASRLGTQLMQNSAGILKAIGGSAL